MHVGDENTICSMCMHQNLPFGMIRRSKMACFGQSLSFSASCKQLKTPPPYFEGAGCKQAGCRGTQITKTPFTACVCSKICHFHEKNGQNGRFWSKIEFFSLRQAVEDPPPLF